MSFWRSKKPQLKQASTVTPGQQQGVDTLASMAQQFPEFFQSLGFDPTRIEDSFQKNIAGPARQQFQEQTAPGIQERFIGAGAGRSSSEQRALGQAGSQLEQGLAGSLAQQLQQGEQFSQQSQLQALMGALGLGLGTKTFENIQMPGQQSGLMSLLPSVFKSAGSLGSGFLGGPGGTALWQKLFPNKTAA